MSTTTSDIAAGDDRTTAQFFFECGYGAAYADGFMENGQKPAFTLSDDAIERAWAIAPEAHDDREEWDRHMAATQQPPLRVIKDAGAVVRSLQIRSPLNRAIYQAIRDFRMGNMCDEDGYPWPLVDLMSNPAPCDISTGEEQMVSLADDVCEAVEALSGWQPIETAPKDAPFGTWIIGCRAGQPESVGPVTWRNGFWFQTDGERWIENWLTHWMPLPQAPEQTR